MLENEFKMLAEPPLRARRLATQWPNEAGEPLSLKGAGSLRLQLLPWIPGATVRMGRDLGGCGSGVTTTASV